MHGLCYWTSDTSQNEPRDVQALGIITKPQLIGDTIRGNLLLQHYLGEQGFSVHITNKNNEILMGEPGSIVAMGSVIRKKVFSANGMDEIDDSVSTRIQGTFFGFSVLSGYFEIDNESKLLYLASAPKEINGDKTKSGAVYIFDIVTEWTETFMKKYFTFYGDYWGEYFGYSILVEDFDNDGLMDVAIGAPHRYSGAVYVYKNQKTNGNELDFQLHRVLKTEHDGFGMFGTTLSKIGDINQDGYNGNMIFHNKNTFHSYLANCSIFGFNF